MTVHENYENYALKQVRAEVDRQYFEYLRYKAEGRDAEALERQAARWASWADLLETVLTSGNVRVRTRTEAQAHPA